MSFKIENSRFYDDLGVVNHAYSATAETGIMTLFQRDFPAGNSSDGSLIYDKTTNEFKGHIKGY